MSRDEKDDPALMPGAGAADLTLPVCRRTAPRAAATPRLVCETFSTSRLVEFCSERELTALTGHAVEDWLLVVLKELVDNGIDIAEEFGVWPVIEIIVSTARGEITVADINGLPRSAI
jgi:hypothetical protein